MRVLEKRERRLGEKLFLKGDRCQSQKCALTRRAYAPGIHGKSRRRGLSEYGQLVKEKQKVRFLYGLDSKDVEVYSKKATSKSGVFSVIFLKLLESRLDNVVFRTGLAGSRRIARQLVNHGHALVNGKTVNIPSYQVKKGEVISLKERALASPRFADLETKLKKHYPPTWINLDRNKKTGTIVAVPGVEETELTADVMKIKEFYSR